MEKEGEKVKGWPEQFTTLKLISRLVIKERQYLQNDLALHSESFISKDSHHI